jgi:hypothetical protein
VPQTARMPARNYPKDGGADPAPVPSASLMTGIIGHLFVPQTTSLSARLYTKDPGNGGAEAALAAARRRSSLDTGRSDRRGETERASPPMLERPAQARRTRKEQVTQKRVYLSLLLFLSLSLSLSLSISLSLSPCLSLSPSPSLSPSYSLSISLHVHECQPRNAFSVWVRTLVGFFPYLCQPGGQCTAEFVSAYSGGGRITKKASM